MDIFESKDGDYSVKIMNTSGEPREFSIICNSPFLPNQEPEKLRRDIDEFQKEKSTFVKWENLIISLTLLVGILTLVFGVINVFIVRMSENTETTRGIETMPDLLTIIIAAVFFGLSVWAVAMPIQLLFSRTLRLKTLDKYFAVSILIVVLMLIMTFFFFLIVNSQAF